MRDPEIVKYSEQRHREHTLGTQLRYLNTFTGHFWGIYDVRNDEHVGNLTAAVDANNKIADVGILLSISKRGYGTEAWQAACGWLLDPHCGALRKLEAGCAACNLPMKRILEKTNFKFEGERKNHFIIDGSPYGELFYGRFR